MHNHDKSKETVESIRELKRRIYFWAIAAGLLVLIIGWLFKPQTGTATLYDRVIFPFLTALFVGFLIVLWRTRFPLGWIELSLFAVTALSMLGKFFEILFTPETPFDPDHLVAFSDTLYWIPLVYILAFLLFGSHRRLLVSSLIFFGAFLILGLTQSILVWRSNGEVADLYLLGRFYLANAVYIVLLMLSVRLN